MTDINHPAPSLPAPLGPQEKRTALRAALLVGALALFAHVGLTAGGIWSFDKLNYDDPQVLAAVEDAGVADILTGTTYYAYKPVYFLSLKVDALFGSATVAVAHVVNWLLHGLAAFLLVLLLSDVLRRPWIALAAGVLFAVHPVHVENVAWISERKDVLSLVLVLWAHLAFRRSRTRGGVGFWVAPLLLLLAGLTKGTVWSYAGVLVVDQLLYTRAQQRSALSALASPAVVLLMLVAVGGVILDGVVASRSGVSGIDHGVSTVSLMAAMASVHVRYVLHLLAPVHLALDYAVDPAGSWANPLAWLGVALVAAVVVLFFRSVRRGGVLFAFAAAFWIFGLAPVNNIWPRTTTLMADRYLHVPAIGAYLLLAWLIARTGRWRGLVLGAATLLLVVLCTMRTGVFRDSQHVWSDNIASVPTSALARIQRGVDSVGSSAFQPALEDADAALVLAPRPELQVRARLLRCGALYGLGDFEALREAANDAVTAAEALARNALVHEDPRTIQAQGQIFRGQALEAFDERYAALDAYTRAARLDPRSWSAWFNLGTQLARSRDNEKLNQAIHALRTSRDLAPGRLDVGLQLATIYGRRGNKRAALAALQHAEDRHGRVPEVLYTRANVVLQMGNDWQRARDLLRELREIDATHPKGKRLEADIELAIGRAALAKGRAESKSKLLRRAVEHFDEALRIRATHWQAHIFAGDALAEQGRYGEARERYQAGRKDGPREHWIAGMMARTACLEAAVAARRAKTRADITGAAQIVAGAVNLDLARIDLGFAPLQEELPLLRELTAVLDKGQVPESDLAATLLCCAALLVTGDEVTALTDLRTVFSRLGGSERTPILLDAALVLRAVLYERQTDFERASADFKLLGQRRPKLLLPKLRLLQIDLRVKEAHRLTATGYEANSEEATKALRAVEETAERARSFADAHPESSEAGLLAVQSEINLQRWTDSLRRLNVMEQVFPENPTVYRGFNAVYVAWYTKTRERRYVMEADLALRKALDLDPRDVRTLMDASQLARVSGDLQSALKNAQSARDMESYAGGPASRMLSDLHIELGKQALQGGQLEAVKKAFSAARRVAPQRAGSWVLEGELVLKSQSRTRLKRAYALAMRAKELEPYDADVNSLLARIHVAQAQVARLHMGRYRVPRKGLPARVAFDKLPPEEQEKRRKGYAYKREQFRVRAIEDLNMALLLDPGSEKARDLRAQVEQLLAASSTTQHERRQEARASYEKGQRLEVEKDRVGALYAYLAAVRLHPEFKRAHLHLVQAVHYLINLLSVDKPEGRETAEKYLGMAHRSLSVLETLDTNREFVGLYYYRGLLNMWDWRHKGQEHAEAKEVARLSAIFALEHFVLRSRAAGETEETSEAVRDAEARLEILRGAK